MRSLKDCVGKDLQWKGLGFDFNPEEIFYSKDLVARIVWKPEYLISSKKPLGETLKNSKSFRAEGETKEGKWLFERQGFLFNRKLIIKKSGKIVATCPYSQTNKTVEIKLSNEKIFRIKQRNILHPKYSLETDTGEELISLQVSLIKALGLKESKKLKIFSAAKSVSELSVLFLIFVYFLSLLTWDTRFI